ncbi:hypothetical protein DEU56DRAFT_983018 [Suillus clintonianus]|uniref:uncharacterized protein n=1 Tax=Suillus clintonianus TaxID=1904413 RepID=UPI001B860405|nr:uncharacterized protein DEU56DRAFT_983018 [Suillus clintonianus]KAG2126242.1 hypothetical protein DEU56DRAFT_983018 [Suillus clintonianus]
MTLISDDPSYWPLINSGRIGSYFEVAAGVAVVYDWALTFGQEVELVWRQHWSLMTILYLSVRGLPAVNLCWLDNILAALSWIVICHPEHTGRSSNNLVDRCSESSAPMPVPASPIQLTAIPCRDVGRILYLVWDWTNVVAFPMLCVIMITRLHAMYQRSTRILIFLVVVCLAVNIVDLVVMAMETTQTSGEELILSGTYSCTIGNGDNAPLLFSITWILGTVWEVLTLCLAVWIAVKHFRELRQYSAGGIMGDCFTVLIKSHVFYFASYVAVSCFSLIVNLSPTLLTNPFSLENQILIGVGQILGPIQSFVLGPRLVLSVREYNARLVADSDAATAMTSIAFQERVHISTGSSV